MKIDPAILDFVTGKLSYDEFELMLYASPELWQNAQSLVTKEFIEQASRSVPMSAGFGTLQANNGSIKSAVLSFGLGSAYGRRLLHSILSDLAEYWNPGIQRKAPLQESPEDVLLKIGLEDLGGPETDHIIRKVLTEAPEGASPKERRDFIKAALRQAFHLMPRKRPAWVQEPEWPMGKNSPMQYLRSEKEGELVRFLFQDVDTKELRVIEQFF